MKSFEEWTNELAQPKELDIEELSDGYCWVGADDLVYAECRSCGKAYEIDPEWVKDGWDQNMSYCGGNQFCTP